MSHEDTPPSYSEEQCLLECINRLRRQFEIDSKPYVDKLVTIRSRQPSARFYLPSGEEYLAAPVAKHWNNSLIDDVREPCADSIPLLGQPRTTTFTDKVYVVGPNKPPKIFNSKGPAGREGN